MVIETPLHIVGVITDTHVPDRYNQVSPDILALFKQTRVNTILHLGDISSPVVVEVLKRLAPVYAVRGNRDWAFGKSLPLFREITLAGVSIGMTHGHGGWKRYLTEKARYFRHGYEYDHMRDFLMPLFPRARVILYGHTHRPEKHQENGQLLFNPGAAYPCRENGYHVQAGLLRIYIDNRVEGEIVELSKEPPPRAK